MHMSYQYSLSRIARVVSVTLFSLCLISQISFGVSANTNSGLSATFKNAAGVTNPMTILPTSKYTDIVTNIPEIRTQWKTQYGYDPFLPANLINDWNGYWNSTASYPINQSISWCGGTLTRNSINTATFDGAIVKGIVLKNNNTTVDIDQIADWQYLNNIPCWKDAYGYNKTPPAAMNADWDAFWKNAKSGDIINFAGGILTVAGPASSGNFVVGPAPAQTAQTSNQTCSWQGFVTGAGTAGRVCNASTA